MTAEPAAPAARAEKRKPSFQLIQAASVLLLLAAICAVAAVRTETFFTWRNLVSNVLTNSAALGIIACGMTLVMIAGGFDLSVASSTAVCSVVAVLLLRAAGGQAPWLAVGLAIAGTALVGTLLGGVNGVLISCVGVNPFVTTLSTMLVFRGIALILTHGGQTLGAPDSAYGAFRGIYWGSIHLLGSRAMPIKVPILIFLGVFVLSFCLLRFTRFGHYVYAVGGNENASWLAGINTPLVKAATYTLTGLACAIAAVIYTSMSRYAQAEGHLGLEMLVIASVIVGGTPLGGGSGGLGYSLIGLLLLSVIENLLPQFGVQTEYHNIVRGLIILVVVTIDVLVRGRGKKARR